MSNLITESVYIDINFFDSMILIVDDKPENIFSLKSILEVNNFKVDTALSGEEALKKILKNFYALIILDVQMPGMDGFEVAETISGFKKAKDIPIIFLSAASTHKTFITKGYASGGIDYVTKPVDADILLLKVKTFYRLYEQKSELNQMQKALRAEIEVRKKAEEKLEANVKELHTIIESLPLIAFTATADGKIDFVNKDWYRYSESALVFPQSPPNEVDIETEWKQTVLKKLPLEREVNIKDIKTNLFLCHLLKITPVIAEDGQIIKWIGTFTNIHEQKMVSDILEQKVFERTHELLETNKKLEESNHDLQQFASVASHDLKEPLRKIQVFSSIIKDKQQRNEGIEAYLDKIVNSSERMSKLIEDLLNFSRLSQADIFKPTSINEIIIEILSDLELTISEKKASIIVDEIPIIDAVPGLIRQLFQNIISNALKFSLRGKTPVITIKASITEGLLFASENNVHDNFCKIVVTDNGIGFDEKYASKIFTLFQRLNTRDQYEGTGIGLAIVKKIVDKHNGQIIANSTPGSGAAFTILLPLVQQHRPDEKEIESAEII